MLQLTPVTVITVPDFFCYVDNTITSPICIDKLKPNIEYAEVKMLLQRAILSKMVQL